MSLTMYCEVCGTTLSHEAIPGEGLRSYCRKCDPPKITILPVKDGSLGIIGHTGALSRNKGQNISANSKGQHSPPPPLSKSNVLQASNTIAMDSSTDDTIEILANGIPILSVYANLPKEAAQGALAYIKGETAAYVFDGDEWQNLGMVARALSGKDANCDRRAAIAATKRKQYGEG